MSATMRKLKKEAEEQRLKGYVKPYLRQGNTAKINNDRDHQDLSGFKFKNPNKP
ncbi:hypothetical protein [Vibrio breoganii]|uniref:hypothetical protein n=1 Tax=Vibrio breoganii TaxID=553239 RepID=UPI0021C36B91|nr:hypothetical protein [Vibrio breoganii]MDN3716971.1 hypothetical protein [Vibrio breoganii]